MKKNSIIVGVFVFSLFVTMISCVQGDVYDDLYEDISIDNYVRVNKRTKDYSYYYQNYLFFLNSNYVNGECCAMAVGMACGVSPYTARTTIIKEAYGINSITSEDVERYLNFINMYEQPNGVNEDGMVVTDDWYSACIELGHTPQQLYKNQSTIENKLNESNTVVIAVFNEHIAQITGVGYCGFVPVVEVCDPNTSNVGGGNPNGLPNGYLMSNHDKPSLRLSDILYLYFTTL